jgi:zinc protease
VPAWTERVRRQVLPNGLTLLVHRGPMPAVAVVAHLRAGFLDEPDRWTGLSHVLEHMIFKGSPRFGPGELARALKRAGGYVNAFTSYDATEYYAVLPPAGAEQAILALADAIRAPRLDAEELRRELGVIAEEARRKRDTAAAVAQETLHEALYDVHRMRRWRIGQESAILAFTRDDVSAYHASRYVPERAVVAVAGDVDPDTTLDLLARHWGDWTASTADIPAGPEEPARRELRVRTIRGDVQAAELRLGWRAVPPLHPDAVALELLAAALGTGRGSRLSVALRLTGLATGTAASFIAPSELGLFALGAALAADRLDPALQAIGREVVRVTRDPLPPDDLERARTQILAQLARRYETAEGRASALAASEALRDVALLAETEARLRSLTAEEVREAAAQYLDPAAVAAAAFLPRNHQPDLSVDQLRTAFNA